MFSKLQNCKEKQKIFQELLRKHQQEVKQNNTIWNVIKIKLKLNNVDTNQRLNM